MLAQPDVLIGLHYYRNGPALRRYIEECAIGLSQTHLFRANVSSAGAAQRLVDAFVEWAGGIDVLIQLTGGIRRPVPWDELTEDQWRADLDLNLLAPFFLARTAMRHMKSRGGKVILTGTASARHGGGQSSLAYGVAKSGIEFLTKALAREGAPFRILVNSVCPGFIETEFHTRRMGRTQEDLGRRADLIPLKRAGTPAEAAAVFVFLASPLADYITGECVAVSGGDWL